jgi:hypothetical protein
MTTVDFGTLSPRNLGMLWLLYGVLRVLAAAFLVVYSSTATLMAGALMTRVANPFAMMSEFHIFYLILIAYCIVCAILSFRAAAALMSGRGSARRHAVLAAFVCLPELPLGVILGVYTLLVVGPRPAPAS